jgi:hypothetical protein
VTRHFSRRRLLSAGLVAAVLLALLAVLFFVRGQDLKFRLAEVSRGMTREEVEDMLGPPVVFLPTGPTRTGGTLIWVDQLWQAEVVLGFDGRVIECRCTPSDSLLRRTVGRVFPLPM